MDKISVHNKIMYYINNYIDIIIKLIYKHLILYYLMKILVFDTETTGLPTERNASIISTSKWPYIVQLSYILYDTDEHMVIDYSDNIIKLPENVQISPESENIHKITKEISQTKGIDIKQELIYFNKALLEADIIVGHNISFDKRVIMVECIRNKIEQNFTLNNKRKPEYCTMKNSTNICKIITQNANGEEYYKYPKLVELYKYLFNEEPAGLHNSMVDVLVCLRCYGKIKNNIDYLELSPTFKMLNNMYI
jgi:DNA polymerase III subunit epsilon